jgi:hypothetical protein
MLFLPFKGISQNAQDIMETIITSGSNATGSSGSVTYSIGQVFYTYIGVQAVYNVAAGIQHQETEENLGTPEIEEPTTEMVVFPNPTADYVTVSMKGTELESAQRSYQLYDIQGRLLRQNIITQNETQVSLNNLSISLYLLTIYVDNKVYKTFKILKK